MKRSTFKTAAVAAGTVALVAALAACAPARPGTGGGTVRGRKRCPRGRGSRRDPRARFLRRRGGGILEGHLPQRVPNLYGQRVQQPPGQAGLPDRVPELVTMYAGYGFAKGYDEAAGHPYSRSPWPRRPA